MTPAQQTLADAKHNRTHSQNVPMWGMRSKTRTLAYWEVTPNRRVRIRYALRGKHRHLYGEERRMDEYFLAEFIEKVGYPFHSPVMRSREELERYLTSKGMAFHA